MPVYRAYLIKDKRIAEAPTLIEAEADKLAIERAKQLVDGHDVELWDGARFVIGLRNPGEPTEPATIYQNAARPSAVCPVCSLPMIAIATADRNTGLREVIYRCEACTAESIRLQKLEK